MKFRIHPVLLVVSVLIGLGLLFLVGTSLISNWTREDWRLMRPQMEIRLRELAMRPSTRPVLWGETTAGNAFDYYNEIGRTFDRLAVEHSDLVRSMYKRLHLDEESEEEALLADVRRNLDGSAVTPPVRKEMVAREALWWIICLKRDSSDLRAGVSFDVVDADFRRMMGFLQPVLDLVRRGAHCSGARRDVAVDPSFPLGSGDPRFPPLVVEEIEQIALERCIDDGDHEEALRYILDGLQCGRDFVDDPSWLWNQQGADRIFRLIKNNFIRVEEEDDLDGMDHQGGFTDLMPHLNNEGRRLLARALEKLTRHPRPFREFVACQFTILYQSLDEGGLAEGMEHRFDLPLMIRKMDHNVEAFSRSDPMSWDSLRKLLKSKTLDLQSLEDSMVYRASWPLYEPCAWLRFDAISRLAVLRVATQDSRKSEGSIRDAYGNLIRSEARKGRTYYWSVGSNGIDERGRHLTDDLSFFR